LKAHSGLIDQYNALQPVKHLQPSCQRPADHRREHWDLGGLSIAFAYQIAHEDDPGVAGRLHAEQRLFMSWAASGRKGADEMLLQRMATDPHSPLVRCNQIVRNLSEFYAAFHVAESDALWLDEEQRVKIW
jgi:putative endopeptidase